MFEHLAYRHLYRDYFLQSLRPQLTCFRQYKCMESDHTVEPKRILLSIFVELECNK